MSRLTVGAPVKVALSSLLFIGTFVTPAAPANAQALMVPTTLAGFTNLFDAPIRVVDSRAQLSGVPAYLVGSIATNASHCYRLAGGPLATQLGIPGLAGAVVLNVTAVGFTVPGWLTVYPGSDPGAPVPPTSTVNFDPNHGEYAVANNVIAKLGGADGGSICVAMGSMNNVQGSSHVVLDVAGWIDSGDIGPAATDSVNLLTNPARLVDTRTTVNGIVGGGPIANGGSRCWTVIPSTAIPAPAVQTAGLVVNVTAVGYNTQGFVTVHAGNEPVPTTSTVNFDPASAFSIANGTSVRTGLAVGSSQICADVGTVNNVTGHSDVVIDLVGWLTPLGGVAQPLLAPPGRVIDTRTNGGGAIATGQQRCFTVAPSLGNPANNQGVPATAAGVMLNVTAVGYTTNGWLTVFPNRLGATVPKTSTVNFSTSQYAIANGTQQPVLQNGNQVCVAVGTVDNVPGSSQVVIDVIGYMRSPTELMAAAQAQRIEVPASIQKLLTPSPTPRNP